MNRRYFGIALLALLPALTGCSGAGVSSNDLRGKVSGEVAQIVVNREQLSPWTATTEVDPARLDAAIGSVRGRLINNYSRSFDVAQLHDLRRFFSSPDGQLVTMLAYAAEGGGDRPDVDISQFGRVEAAFSDPVIAESVSILRQILRQAFTAEFAF